MKGKPCWSDIVTFGGAVMAFMIGAGFASGQETLQFFTHLGLGGSLAACAVTMLLFTWFGLTILEDGRRLQLDNPNMIFAHYCGRRLGLVLEWFAPILYFLALSVMLSGAGAAVSQHYGTNAVIGSVAMAIATAATVLLGLRRLVRIIGSIGPIIIIFSIVLGILGIIHHPGGLANAEQFLSTTQVQGISSSWILSGTLYGASSLVALMPFLAGMGKQARNRTDTLFGGILGGVVYGAGLMIYSTGLLANLDHLYDKQIPSLALAQLVVPGSASIFAVLLLGSIYTTTSPILWTVCNRITSDEQSWKYKAGGLILAVTSCFGAQLKFSTLVGVILPSIGYVGLVLIAGMLLTRFVHREHTADIG